MKNNLLFLFFFLAIALITSSCTKEIPLTPVQLPVGTFSGYLEAVHINPRTTKSDTTFEWVTLTLSGADGFKITGDTTVHAGGTNMQADGFGSYATNGSQYMQFADSSLPAAAAINTVAPSKYHLNGLYIYAYGGESLLLLTASADTLYLSYGLSLNHKAE